ncbi:DUF6904 family protein [Youngiibacter fragilis]|uniref:Uncharacterized protein n=1 Tax=Youngiibacter fragilis 232.1 TaxID=994573 RepID=V7I2N9_9CLOT|nr:hypothetical protein [Youngiibacter fragilis]ETA79551.1 hypothetical protein T472_0216170 [Youngiibacter fragilis 232.1]
MIKVENTPSYTGVKISGDYNDLYSLVEALHEICDIGDDRRLTNYRCITTRVLGLCYDIRHAFQGDREVELVDNGMDEDKMKWHNMVVPKVNVCYSCNSLYPEMFYIMIALNSLVELRIRNLTKTGYIFNEAFDRKVIWDKSIANVRMLQAAFTECIKGTITQMSYARWLNFMNRKYSYITSLSTQYLDLLNTEYVSLTKEKRIKNISAFAKRIAEFENDSDHQKIKNEVWEAARQYGCPPDEIVIRGIDYPDEIVW